MEFFIFSRISCILYIFILYLSVIYEYYEILRLLLLISYYWYLKFIYFNGYFYLL